MYYNHWIGLSDPYVIVELYPRHIFEDARKQTAIRKKTLNPDFGEVFVL